MRLQQIDLLQRRKILTALAHGVITSLEADNLLKEAGLRNKLNRTWVKKEKRNETSR